MNKQKNRKWAYSRHVSIFGLLWLLFLSCENSMSDIDRLASIPEEEAVDVSKDVKVIYSDSARVKGVLTAPEMRIYHDSTSNTEFQKGVEIVFYGDDLKETHRITSDYALQRTRDEIYEFRKNVVVNRADGSIIKSEEIIYDERNKRYYNNVEIIFFFNDERGNQVASSFTSDSEFKRIEGQNMTGYFVPSSNSPFPSFGN